MNTTPAYTENTREFCLYAGILGMLFSCISIIHNLMVSRVHWLSVLLILPNLSAGVSFILLLKKNRYLFLSLIISLVLFVIYYVLIVYLFLHFVVLFSPSTILLSVYTLVILVYGYSTELPGKLKENYLNLIKEKEYWKDKI